MSYSSLLPLLKKTKSPLSVEQFHERINIVFHDNEAMHYDEMHADMRDSLQEQIDLLAEDLLASFPLQRNLKLLDIGCGTGLSTQFLLHSKVNQHIHDVTLLDTSSKMLAQAELKARNWNKSYQVLNGTIADLTTKFDMIIISSVLHHIPDLEEFLKDVDRIMNSNGILIHLQDPNGDYLDDPLYNNRVDEFAAERNTISKRKKMTDFISKSIRQYINRLMGRKSYIDRVNDQLISEKTIGRRMSASEIWSVTDIHVETKNDKEAMGISLNFLKKVMLNFSLISCRSYGFYGSLKSELFGKYLENEIKFIVEKQPNGRNLSAVWIKKNYK